MNINKPKFSGGHLGSAPPNLFPDLPLMTIMYFRVKGLWRVEWGFNIITVHKQPMQRNIQYTDLAIVITIPYHYNWKVTINTNRKTCDWKPDLEPWGLQWHKLWHQAIFKIALSPTHPLMAYTDLIIFTIAVLFLSHWSPKPCTMSSARFWISMWTGHTGTGQCQHHAAYHIWYFLWVWK